MRDDRVAGQQVVVVEGEIDLATVPRLRDALAHAITGEGDGPVFVDLDGVTVLADIGLGVLLGAAATGRRAGRVVEIVCSTPRLVELLRETGLDRVIDVRSRVTDPR